MNRSAISPGRILGIPIELKSEAELMDALGEMDRDSVSPLPVMPGDQILGILGRDDVISIFTYIEHAQPAAKTIHWQDAVCIGINRTVNTVA